MMDLEREIASDADARELLERAFAALLDDTEEAADFRELAEAEALEEATIATFSEAGLMTQNEGLVLSLADGTELQLQIVRVVR